VVTYPPPTFHNTNVPFLHGQEWSNSRVHERLLVKFVHAANRGLRFQTCKNLPQNDELNDLYSSPSIVRVIKSGRMRWAGIVGRMGEMRGVHRVFVGKPEGKRPLGRPRRR
jgi:hypothetical protein